MKAKYTITFSIAEGKRHFQCIVEVDNPTEDEKENERLAFLLAKKKAIAAGVKLPAQVWTRTKKHAETFKKQK